MHQPPVVPPTIDPLMRIGRLEEVVGFKRSKIYELISEGRFPAGIKLTGKLVVWNSSAVAAWIQDRINESAGVRTDVQR